MAALRGDNASILADFGPHSAANVAPRSTMATAMLFGTIIFASAALAARMYFAGITRAVTDAQCPRSSPLDVKSFSSIYTLLYHSTIFGLILLYAYICEYHPPFPHANKTYDRDEFFFMTALLFVVSAFTLSKNDKSNKTLSKESDLEVSETKGQGRVAEVNDANEVLNRDQTEEWKGWMQFMFLLYHYYHGEEVYNAIRIMITCYVWMTGFGNFSFFYLKSDFSAVRVLQMLWRLNFLVVFLCLSQGTTYILYYICLLHTYYFLMVYVTMRIAKHVNYTKWGIRIKLGILALVIFCVWDVKNNLFYIMHRPFLGETPMLGATSGAMWEWYFRSSLDHWSTFLGMIFALNFPITSLFYRKLEAQPLVWHILGKLAMGLALFGVFFWWVMGPFQESKFQYNATNAYYGFIPLITYIYFRNLTPWLRSHSLDLLHQIGKTTLETYLMQHHIWLTSNAKSLLTLIPGWPKCNMLLVTVLYYVLSRRLYQLTLYLRGMILPDDRNTCLRHLVFLSGAIGGYYGLALALDSMGILSLTMVLLVSVFCGLLLYWVIVDTTWDVYDASAGSHFGLDSSAVGSKSSKRHTSWRPPIIAGSVVLLLGLFWNSMSIHGAGKIQPLPEGCQEFVNEGAWIPLDGCDEGSFGSEYRQFGVTSHGTCSSQNRNYVWGWNETFSASHCRFTNRDSRSLKQLLKHRTITFIGDSISRHLYQAVLRSLGISDAGEYNTHLPKWTDMNATVGETYIDFEWAPYSKDQVGRMQNITNRPETARKEGELVRPDLVVLGGGAWDRLHVYGTDEEIASHRSALKDLTIEIRKARDAGIPVAWVVPTTINSNALLTDDKRENMNEEKMEEFRTYYAEVGVPRAASFVLDGPVWTRGRVSESYDGVHYPHSVYDAGSQILVNAMDWLLPEKDTTDIFVPLEPGSMANPRLGCMMLALAFIGLFFFDGFMGFSYFASLFVPSVSPKNLYEESYSSLHQRKKLPPIDFSAGIKCPSSPLITSNGTSSDGNKGIGNGVGPTTLTRRISGSSEDEEAVSLVSVPNGRKLEITY